MKMPTLHKHLARLAAAAALCAFALAAATAEASVATIQNENARLEFDLGRGTFTYTLLPAGTVAIADARAGVEGWYTTDSAYRRKAVAQPPQPSQTLHIECTGAPDAPDLLLEYSLDGDQLILRTGLRNATAAPVRVKKYHPLDAAALFPGERWGDVRTLNGSTGENPSAVGHGPVRSTSNNLLLTFKQGGERRSVVLGALKTADFCKWVAVTTPASRDGSHPILARLEGNDPVGRLVDPAETYIPADTFYFAASTPCPFEALELYARRLRDATAAAPNPYDFPTLCAWYAGVWKGKTVKSEHKFNTTAGMVEEAEKIKDSGFLSYSRAAVRLVPDTYTALNPQGWWDDEHWRAHGGYYVAPYDTSEKFGAAVRERGVVPFTYMQVSGGFMKEPISRDFREKYPDWIFGNGERHTLDFSKPEVRAHVRERFAALRDRINGLMVDYCDDLWNHNLSQGGYADKQATATAVYRNLFIDLKASLGPDSWLHERNYRHPDNDLTLGHVDSQRTTRDTKEITPALVATSGLRWYKNRLLIAYDMDAKELGTAWKSKDWTGTDEDGLRMTLTMAYVAASRLILADSFRDLPAQTLRDLARTFPYPAERRPSARPIDAFICDAGQHPRVYHYAADPDRHQLTLYNNALPTREAAISVPLAGEPADGAMALDPAAQYHVYDFWNNEYVGKLKGADTLTRTLRPGEAQMLSVRRAQEHPQVISTNRHITQGLLDLSDVKWNGSTLSGKAKVVAGDPFEIVIALNGHRPDTLKPTPDGRLATLRLERPADETVEWSVTFRKNK